MIKNQNIKDCVRKALVLNLLVAYSLIIICGVYFETNDDIAMCNIVAGAYGEYSSHLVFENIIYGEFLQMLYRFLPEFPWYATVQILVVFISLSTITFCFLVRNRILEKTLICVLIPYMSYECYCCLQFTKTAGVAVVAGFLLLGTPLKQGRRMANICGDILVVGGSLIRFNSFVMVVPYALVLLMQMCQLDFKKGERIRRIRKIMICTSAWIVPIMLALGCHFVDICAYDDDGAWSYYTCYNNLRSELMDYGWPDYEENIDVYQSLGISSEDLALYQSWDFADLDRINSDVLQRLVNAKEHQDIGKKTIKDFLEAIFTSFLQEREYIFVIIILCVLLIYSRYNLLQIYLLMVLLGENFYLFWRGRYLQHRVDIVLTLAFVVCFVVSNRCDIEVKNPKRVFLVLLMTTLCVTAKINPAKTDEGRRTIAEYQAMANEISEDKEHLYLCSVSSHQFGNAYSGGFDNFPVGIYENVYCLGGWEVNIPVVNSVLSRYGLANPFRDCVDRENVYIIDNNIQPVINYIKQHYNSTATAELVKTIHGYQVYRVKSQ